MGWSEICEWMGYDGKIEPDNGVRVNVDEVHMAEVHMADYIAVIIRGQAYTR